MDTERRPAVARELDRLEKAVEACHGTAEQLAKRLEGVFNHSITSPPQGEGDVPEEEMPHCPLSENLLCVTRRAELLSVLLNGLLDRLEV